MNTHTVISKVDKKLVRLLWNSIKNDSQVNSIISDENQISLASPQIFEIEPSKKLSLFLYQITEFSAMRNQPNEDIKQDKKKPPPLYLTLHYLVTPNTQNTEKDHVLLGKIMRVFAENPIIVAPQQQGSISKDTTYMRILMNSLTVDELNKLWSILGMHYRLSVSYTMAPIKIEIKAIQKPRTVIER